MNNIISAQEAFNAVQNGKTVLCRYAGNGTLPADKDFSSLDQMPATVFFQPYYEFCIKIEMMELANLEFTKPLTPQDVIDGQEIFIVMPTKILRTKYDAEHDDIHNSVMNGFAQADQENAVSQLQAMGALFGTSIDVIPVIDGFTEKPKRKRASRKATEVKQNDDTSLDDIIGPASGQALANDHIDETSYTAHSQFSTSNDVVKEVSANFETLDDHIEFLDLRDDLLNRAANAKTPEEANSLVRYTPKWSEEQRAPLIRAIHKRLEELNQEKNSEAPSLMVRIQNAPDLTALDALEIDVAALDPVIQPEMMKHIKARRQQLDVPEYLADSL